MKKILLVFMFLITACGSNDTVGIISIYDNNGFNDKKTFSFYEKEYDTRIQARNLLPLVKDVLQENGWVFKDGWNIGKFNYMVTINVDTKTSSRNVSVPVYGNTGISSVSTYGNTSYVNNSYGIKGYRTETITSSNKVLLIKITNVSKFKDASSSAPDVFSFMMIADDISKIQKYLKPAFKIAFSNNFNVILECKDSNSVSECEIKEYVKQ